MLLQIVAILFYLGLITFLILFILHFASRSYSSLHGAPYVPTNRKDIQRILEAAKLTHKTTFLEPGCGDGRVVIQAVKTFGVKGTGIDINPLLIRSARQKSFSLANCTFKTGNIQDIDYSPFNVVYLYLLPELIESMRTKMELELEPSSLVISHWFVIPAWKHKLEQTIKAGKHPTYFYRL